MVAIVGGRYGTASQHGNYSISNVELRRAIHARQQVYIFIEASVRAEYQTYLLNKGTPNIQYRFVDDPRVYEWIEELDGLPANNAMASFESSADIIGFLREQWAGLFQRMLEEQRKATTRRVAEDLSATADTLRRLVTTLGTTSSPKAEDSAAGVLILENHPLFVRLKRLFDIEYRVFFTSRDELTAWLKATQGFVHQVAQGALDSPDDVEWFRGPADADGPVEYELLKIAARLFDREGKLLSVSVDDFDDSWVKLERRHGQGLSGDEILETIAPPPPPPPPPARRRRSPAGRGSAPSA